MQTYELGLVRVSKGSKSKNMVLKVNNDDNDESSEDEDTKFKSYITRQFKNENSRKVTRIVNNLDFFSSSPKTKARENSRILVKATMFLLGQSAMDVKDMDT